LCGELPSSGLPENTNQPIEQSDFQGISPEWAFADFLWQHHPAPCSHDLCWLNHSHFLPKEQWRLEERSLFDGPWISLLDVWIFQICAYYQLWFGMQVKSSMQFPYSVRQPLQWALPSIKYTFQKLKKSMPLLKKKSKHVSQ
jgi:hypothetical protein